MAVAMDCTKFFIKKYLGFYVVFSEKPQCFVFIKS